MPTLHHDNISLHYQIFGDGPGVPLLCLHGGGCQGRDFEALGALLGASRKLICLDQRGHGTSDKPEGDYAPSVMAGDAAALLRHLDIGRVALLGHSLGGAVALSLLARGDVAIAGLISLEAPLIRSEGITQGLVQMCEAFEKGKDEGAAFFRQFMGMVVGYGDDPEAYDRLLDALCSVPHHVIHPIVSHISRFDGRPMLAANPALPLLHIDASMTVCDLAVLAEVNPDVWLGRVVGTGHYPHMESPAQVAAMIAHFLEHRVSDS